MSEFLDMLGQLDESWMFLISVGVLLFIGIVWYLIFFGIMGYMNNKYFFWLAYLS